MHQEKNGLRMEYSRIPAFMMNSDFMRGRIGKVIKDDGILQGVFFMGILLGGVNGKIINDYEGQIDFFKKNLEYIMLIFGKIMGEKIKEAALLELGREMEGMERWQEGE